MTTRLAKPVAAVALLAAVWGLDAIHAGRPPAKAALPVSLHVRITQFYASAGILMPGQRAMLCYGVENAKSVSMSPVLQDVYPSRSHCLEIGPSQTTNYTLMAEGYDGTVDVRTLTLPVHELPPADAPPLNVALLIF